MSPDSARTNRSPGRLRTALVDHRYPILAGAIALVAGLVVFWLAHDLFPYHSSNHDEGVYLQQAAMLLEGRLLLTPGSEPLREAFHPWFFVESERGLYPKYTPVPAAIFALGKLAGGYRLALLAVAVANVGLVYGLASEAFDRRTGVLAAAILAAAPTFVLTSSVFLPYAPTTALNLLFALSYVRSVRRESAGYAALAGVAVGLAFFARPYTAVLFATPFVGHALWRIARALRSDPGPSTPEDRESAVRGVRSAVDAVTASATDPTVQRHGTTAALGLALVGVTLAYNAALTGSPLVFPYEAFAPLDGLGFGRRRILGHERVYTPVLALRANATVLWALATRWFTAGPVGTALAVVGAGAVVAGISRDGLDSGRPLGDRTLQVLLIGVAAAVVAGNVYFWGNLNVLGDPAEPGDGLIAAFGPFYHFDLLLPLSALAAHGLVRGAAWIRATASERVTGRALRVGILLALSVTLPAVGALQADRLASPVEENAAYTAKYERAYEPFRTTDTTGGLVFLPPAYGEWRNHPFQWLRNDPGFDGPTVYATARDPADDFAVVDAYPDRDYYRFRYHGEWTPNPNDHVIPVLERLRLREESELAARTRVTVPDRIARVEVAVSNGETTRRYDYRGDPPAELAVDWTVAPDGATVRDDEFVPRTESDATPVPVDGARELSVAITIVGPDGATLTYREELLVRTTGDGDRIQVLWPPASSVCSLVTDCGMDGTYLTDEPDTRPEGVAMNTTVRAVNRSPSAGGPPTTAIPDRPGHPGDSPPGSGPARASGGGRADRGVAARSAATPVLEPIPRSHTARGNFRTT